MRAREAELESPLYGDDIEKVKPIIVEGGSDSAVLDNALELLVQGGRSLPHAMMMMVPEAWGTKFHMSEDKRGFYEYHSALESVFGQAEEAIAQRATLLILTDRGMDESRAPIPVLLASAGLHHHLIRKGLRTSAGIVVETGEAREIMQFALLVGYGANAINPHVAFSTVRAMAEDGLLEEPKTPVEAMDADITAIKKGLLKTFSRI